MENLAQNAEEDIFCHKRKWFLLYRVSEAQGLIAGSNLPGKGLGVSG